MMRSLVSINPATGQVLEQYEAMGQAAVSDIISHSNELFLEWRQIALSQRIQKIQQLSKLLNANYKQYAQIITYEMGKLYKEAVAEVQKCGTLCDFYIEHAERFLADEFIPTEFRKSYVTYQPLGVILSIMPWNFPFWQVFRSAVPALLAGNTVLLKHASNVPGCAKLLEQIFHEAGIQAFNTLLIPSAQVEHVIKNPKVKAVALTGSFEAGSAVAQLASSYIKKTVLELGGSDPYIILKDANIGKALEKLSQNRLLNMGQSCISPKRLIIENAIYDDFVRLFKENWAAYQPGDPFDEKTHLAPLATEKIRAQLHHQVLQSIQKGAHCILGGEFYNQNGFYYQPTILTEVKPGMPAYDEELFGPVACMIRADNEKHAIEIANDSDYGLGGAIFSSDVKKAEKIAKYDIETGSCFVNDFVRSDPRLPFGGIKQSGYGRELSHYGLLEFVNIKTICIDE